MSHERTFEEEMRLVFALLLREAQQTRRLIMALHPQVQALLDAVAQQGTALTAGLTELASAEGKVTDLQKQVGDLQAKLTSGQQIDAEDLTAIASATDTVASSVTTIKAALPQPVEASTVQAAADAAQVPSA